MSVLIQCACVLTHDRSAPPLSSYADPVPVGSTSGIPSGYDDGQYGFPSSSSPSSYGVGAPRDASLPSSGQARDQALSYPYGQPAPSGPGSFAPSRDATPSSAQLISKFEGIPASAQQQPFGRRPSVVWYNIGSTCADDDFRTHHRHLPAHRNR